MRRTPRPLPGVTRAVLSKVSLISLYLDLNSFLDILEKSKFSVLDVFDSVGLDYWHTGGEGIDFISFNRTSLENNSMILPTRSIYPADKVTFTLADLPSPRPISFLNIYLEPNNKFDVILVLEDSRRKELSHSKKMF